MVKFMHLRHTDGKQHSDGKKYPENHGGMTVAYEEDGNVIHYAVAFCSKKDIFCRSVGRSKAAGRLNSPAYKYSIGKPALSTAEQCLMGHFIIKGLWTGDIWFRQPKVRIG